jgi:hypothetical protein
MCQELKFVRANSAKLLERSTFNGLSITVVCPESTSAMSIRLFDITVYKVSQPTAHKPERERERAQAIISPSIELPGSN